MKKKRIIEIVALITILSIGLFITGARYSGKETGQASVSIASPKARIVNENTTQLEELALETYAHDFTVVNYDEDENVSEVGLDYTLSFDMTDEDAPIGMKLYKIGHDEIGNETETEIPLNENLQSVSQNFNAGVKSENNYRLKVWFDLTTGHMDNDTEVNVKLKAVQTKPESN